MSHSRFIRSIVNLTLVSMKNTKEAAPDGVVRLPRIFLILPIVSGSLFSIPTTLMILEREYKEAMVPGFFLLLSIGLFLYFLVWKIEFNDTQFTHRNVFFYSRTYKYAEISDVKKDREDTIIHIRKHRIRVPIESAGAAPFLRIVRRYKKRK